MRYVYTARNEFTAPLIADALHHGVPMTRIVTQYHEGDWLGFGSPQTYRYLESAKRDGFNWYYVDKAYFGRDQFYRVTKNAYQHTGMGKPDYDRLRRFYRRPGHWQQGDAVVICPQSEGHYTMRGESLEHWLKVTEEQIRKYTDRPIIYTHKRSNTIQRSMRKAWIVVTHSSNAAVDAIMGGVPCITTSQCAASAMATSFANLENPHYPSSQERMSWAATLAANQFTLQEIKDGVCWQKVQ